jgi:two-component system, cell cycle response regulator
MPMPQKIMIIDDEPDIRLYLAAAAEDNGYEPLIVDAETPVMEMIAGHKPDLIILDIMMPMRSGISIYHEIRTSPELMHIPIILISGMTGASELMENGFEELIDDASLSKPDAFIEKPVDIDYLFIQIKKILNK